MSQSFQIEFDLEIVTLKALKRACFDFLDKASLDIEPISKGKIIVQVKPNKAVNTDILISDFKNSALEHQTRLETEEDFKAIRKMIIAQAFEPVDNLKEIVEVVEP